jgi:uncharacterized membrane protein
MNQSIPRLPIILATAGFLLSIVLQIEHVEAHLRPAADSYCKIDDYFDCVKVALSPHSRVFDVPLPIWGAVGFLAIGISAFRRSILFFAFSAFSALASIALFVQELVYIKSVCVVCSIVHLACFALLFVAWFQLRKGGLRFIIDKYLFLLELGIPGAIIVLSYIFVPPYWALVSWSNELDLPQGVDEEGHPWIGAINPKVIIHEYTDYNCPHCALAASRSRMRVMKYPDTIRLVRRQQPRMFCPNIGAAHCRNVRAAMCAAEQEKFWQMDDWLFQHAPGTIAVNLEQAARDVGLDLSKLKRCMARDEVYKKADREAKAARRKRVMYTPMYYINDKRLTFAELEQELKSILAK